MTNISRLDDQVAVAGQIDPADLPALADAEITMVISNRPDGEEPGQPTAAEIEAAAEAAGVAFRHIPVAGGITPDGANAMVAALDEAPGRVLAFCKSGTRSAYMWSVARKMRGADGRELIASAAAAGYDLSPLRGYLES